MISDSDRWPSGVIGDETDLGATLVKRCYPFRSARHGNRTEVDDTIKIKQHRVVGVDDDLTGAHWLSRCSLSSSSSS
jgi:hypothetical protein